MAATMTMATLATMATVKKTHAGDDDDGGGGDDGHADDGDDDDDADGDGDDDDFSCHGGHAGTPPFHEKIARTINITVLRDSQGQVSRTQTAPHDAADDDDDAFPRPCSCCGSKWACPCTACGCRMQCTTPRRDGASARAWQLFPL